jgi:hypothetical protein
MTFEEAMQKVMAEEREEQERIAAEADARSNWLRRFEEHLEWFEENLQRTDEYLAWYTAPGSPGLIEHSITAERLSR